MTLTPNEVGQAWGCDDAQWPIVIVGLMHSQLAPPPLATHLERLLASTQSIAICMDIRHLPPIDVLARRRIVEWVQQQTAKANAVVAVAAVVATPLQRGLISAVLWQVKPSIPTRVFSAYEDAPPWLREQLQ